MAQHTITISDEDNGLSIRVEGTGPMEDTLSGTLAKALVSVAKDAVIKASQAVKGECPCPRCRARREATDEASADDTKHTLH